MKQKRPPAKVALGHPPLKKLAGMRGQLGLGLTGLFLQLSLAGLGDLQGRGKGIKVTALHEMVDVHDHA